MSEKWVLIFLTTFLLTRLLLLLYSPYIFHGEEIKEASLGVDLVRGKLQLPFWAYIDSPHAGGSIFVALGNIPFYVLVGQVYLAQKLCALFFSTLVFLVAIFFLTREYGKKLLAIASLLFIFPPPHYLRSSFFNLGNKNEAVLFVLIALYFAFKIFGKGERRSSNYFWLGLACGFGLWVNYLSLTVLATIGILWFLKEKLFVAKREFWYFLGAFLLGLSPFFIYNLQYNFASFNSDQVIDGSLLHQSLSQSFSKLGNVILAFLPQSLYLQGISFFGPQLLSWLVYVIFLASALLILIRFFCRKKKASLGLFLVVYLVVSILMISFTRTRVGGIRLIWGEIEPYKFEYLHFFQPIFLMIASVTLGTSIASRNSVEKGTAYISLVILLAIFMVNYVLNLNFSLPPNGRLLSANYDISANAYEAGFSYARNQAFFKVYNALSDDLRQQFLYGSGASWHYYLREKELPPSLKNLLVSQIRGLLPEERRIFLSAILRGEGQ